MNNQNQKYQDRSQANKRVDADDKMISISEKSFDALVAALEGNTAILKKLYERTGDYSLPEPINQASAAIDGIIRR